MSSKNWTRRQVLKGAGIALSVPWLETFAPRTAKAQAAAARKRYMTMYFPNGTANFWRSPTTGTGWMPSPILAPVMPVKAHTLALSNVSNNGPFGGTNPEPSHSNLGTSTWSAVKPAGQNNGITVDQVIANHLMASPTTATKLHSLQVGLSTLDSSPDGLPGQHSRSMAWKSASEPLYKVVSPQGVFDRIVMGGLPMGGNMAPMPMTDPAVARRQALKKSAIDYIIQSSGDLKLRLGRSDQTRLDQFLTSVRGLEKRVNDAAMPPAPPVAGCAPLTRPTATYGVNNVPAGYNRGEHASLMIDLVVMAYKCDMTRVVSFMLDDARSDFVYNFIKERQFTAGGSTPGTGAPGGYHGMQHAGDTNNGYATINYWNVEKAAEMAMKLGAATEGAAGSILDQTVIFFASGMHGGNHDAQDLPVAIFGGGGKNASGSPILKQDNHILFPQETQLADLHLTVMQKVFGVTQASFGASRGTVDSILT